MDRAPDKRDNASRRRFLQDAARAATVCTLGGLTLGALIREAQALPAQAIRPPGALTEAEFLSACIRCGLCVRDCPYDTLSLARLGRDAPASGTPYFTARDAPCEMCDDIPCVAACPTGALDPALATIDDARMGTAVLVDLEHCLNALGLRCDVCYRVCPLIDEAISLEESHNARSGHHALFMPTVHASVCTGCGKCEQSCVLPESAIKVLPTHLARVEAASHYRLGWEAQDAHGAPLIDGLIDLPDRLPGPGTDNLETPGGFVPSYTLPEKAP